MTIFITALKRIVKSPLNWVFVPLFPLLFAFLISISADNGPEEHTDELVGAFYFGVSDQDGTVLSQALVRQLKMRYNIIELDEEDISAALTNAEIPWVLLIRGGYMEDVLAGRAPALEGYSLTVSDVSALGGVNAETITRALMLLGTADEAAIAAWEEASRVDLTVLPVDIWGFIASWFNFFGFVSLFTAYFVIKTLLDDKRGGMPDRLGVLPQSPRAILTQSSVAAFVTTEITVALLLTVMRVMIGAMPNTVYLFLLLSLYNLFSVGMVRAITSIARDLGAASVAMTMLATLFSMLGGLFWPLDLVPDFMQKLARLSPGYWLGQGIKNIEEITFNGYALPMLFLAGFTAVVLLLGGWKRIQGLEDTN